MAKRLVEFLAAFVVISGLGSGLAQAAEDTSAKNFVPAPDTPSYFVDESALFRGRVGASSDALQGAAGTATVPGSSASSLDHDLQPVIERPARLTRAEVQARRRAERRAARHRTAEARRETERLPSLGERNNVSTAEIDGPPESNEARQSAGQIGKPREEIAVNNQADRNAKVQPKIAVSEAIERAAAPPAPLKQLAASREKPAVLKLPEPVAVLPANTQLLLLAKMLPRLTDASGFARIRHIVAYAGASRAAAVPGATAIAIALVALGFLWSRGRYSSSATLPGAAAPGDGRAREAATTDLNRVLLGLEARIRRELWQGTPFRLSLLPDLWPCHANAMAVAAAIIDLAGEAATELAADGSLVVGTRNSRVDPDIASEVPGAVSGDYVRLTVRENGQGLSEDAFERIFDPDATVRPAIVRADDVIRQFGGFVRVETAEGVGTAVHLYFWPAVAAGSAVTTSAI